MVRCRKTLVQQQILKPINLWSEYDAQSFFPQASRTIAALLSGSLHHQPRFR